MAKGRGKKIVPWWRRWWFILIVVLAVAGGTVWTVAFTRHRTAPAAIAAARPLTEDEADRLAVTRFRNYQVTGVSFSTTVPSAQGPLPIAGYVDFRRHLGYAATELVNGATTETGVLQWNPTTALTWLGVGAGKIPPTTVPTGSGSPRTLSASGSSLDTVLLLLLDLGSDRPDNAQLLRQSDARWLASATVRGTPVDVFQGPSSSSSGGAGATAAPTTSSARASGSGGNTEYYVDANGKLLRFVAKLAAGDVTVEVAASPFVVFPAASGLG